MSMKKSRVSHTERHVRLYHRMMKGAAWKSLNSVARCLYIEIEMRYGGPGSNNGRIHYSVREGAKALNISKTTVATGLAQLRDRGFIVPETLGGFNRKDRHATEWRLTAHASDISQNFATREFERWQPYDEQKISVSQKGLNVSRNGLGSPFRRNLAA